MVSIFSLFIARQRDDFDLLIAELWEAGVTGIVEGLGGLTAFFPADADLNRLAARFKGSVKAVAGCDRPVESPELLQPVMVGSRFYLGPAWRDEAGPEGRLRVSISSGLAFRPGLHTTTQMCLEALEDLVLLGMTVVDIGTGSGILAEAAKKLGADRVIACDSDPQTVAVARAHFVYAGVDIELFEGFTECVETGIADLTIARISCESLPLAEWARVTKSCGAMLLSGQAEDVPRARDQLADVGFTIDRIRAEDEWCSLVVRQAADKMTVQ